MKIYLSLLITGWDITASVMKEWFNHLAEGYSCLTYYQLEKYCTTGQLPLMAVVLIVTSFRAFSCNYTLHWGVYRVHPGAKNHPSDSKVTQGNYIKNQKFRTFKFRTKIECCISKITDTDLILKFDRNAYIPKKLIFGIPRLPRG